jgi:hypothetical protein
VPTEVYPKKVLYEWAEWMQDIPEGSVKARERVSLKPPGMVDASSIVRVEAPNEDVIRMKEKMYLLS